MNTLKDLDIDYNEFMSGKKKKKKKLVNPNYNSILEEIRKEKEQEEPLWQIQKRKREEELQRVLEQQNREKVNI